MQKLNDLSNKLIPTTPPEKEQSLQKPQTVSLVQQENSMVPLQQQQTMMSFQQQQALLAFQHQQQYQHLQPFQSYLPMSGNMFSANSFQVTPGFTPGFTPSVFAGVVSKSVQDTSLSSKQAVITQASPKLLQLLVSNTNEYVAVDDDNVAPYALIAGDVNKLSTELLKIQNSTRGKPTLYSVKLMEFFFSKNELTDKNSNVLGNKPNGGEKKKGLDSQRLHVIEELIKDSVEGDHEKKKAEWRSCTNAMNKKMSKFRNN